MTRSVNGEYLVLGGYDADVGTTSVTGSSAKRVVGRIDATGAIDTTTGLTDAYLTSNIRSVATVDGSAFWTAGTGSAGSNGPRYATWGATTSTQLSTTVTNTRATAIFDGQLYLSSSSGAFLGVSTVGTGLPTTSGQTTTLLNGFPTAAGPSSYQFVFKDANTLYVADDRTNGSGGIQKWTQSGGTWTLAYTLAVTATTGVRGLTGDFSGANPVLYATTSESSANKLVKVTDTGAGSTFTTLATAPANTAFRGVAFTPAASGPANQPPVNALPAAPTALEDVSTSIAGVSVADPDAGTANIKVTLSVPTGTLTVADNVVSGLTAAQITGNGTGTVVITATQAAINTTLADASGLKFKTAADAGANVVLTMTTDDLGNTGSGGAKTDTDTVTIAVTSVNDAPTMDAVADFSINEDAPQQTVSLTGIGPGGGADEAGQTLTVTATSSDPAVIPNPTITSTGATTADLKFTPVANAYGTVTITVRVNDGSGTANGGAEEVVRTFTVTVNPLNDAPALNPISDVTANEDGGEQTVSLAGIGAGPNETGQTLTVT
ncbi:MAG TPA: Ig-like domain-containing protein, partial [Gemmataceae bacterium]|nr:Ig-like domain-containing protein [Gemmataceae bacterium]